MTRREKYPDTKYFKFYNANPNNRITGDCTFRAISTALNMEWKDAVMEMAKLSCETGFAINDKKGIERYLEAKGWCKMKQPRKKNNTKYTGKEFCKLLNKVDPFGTAGNIVANIGGNHIVSIVYENKTYRIFDTWDSSEGCIGNYWVEKK